MPRSSALACPCSLKGVLGPFAAAKALAEGLRAGGVEAVELPVADGGEGTADVLHAARGGAWHEVEVADAFGRPRRARWLLLPDRTAVVESAQAIPLDPERLDALAARPAALLVCLGGTATVDGGRGLREVVEGLPVPTRVACDVSVPLLDAARVFARQKGASPAHALELERRLAAQSELAAVAELPGAGAAGGRVVAPLAEAETVSLSGDPARAADDLRALGERLARGVT